MKITSSKNKTTVLNWAKKNNRGFLWLDDNGFWHAATTKNHCPSDRPLEITGVEGVELPYPPNNHVGKQLAWLRENNGSTQAQIARKMSRK